MTTYLWLKARCRCAWKSAKSRPSAQLYLVHLEIFLRSDIPTNLHSTQFVFQRLFVYTFPYIIDGETLCDHGRRQTTATVRNMASILAVKVDGEKEFTVHEENDRDNGRWVRWDILCNRSTMLPVENYSRHHIACIYSVP